MVPTKLVIGQRTAQEINDLHDGSSSNDSSNSTRKEIPHKNSLPNEPTE